MVSLDEVQGSLLRPPSFEPHPTITRAACAYKSLSTFDLPKKRSYKQQYGDMYFLRLTKIKPAIDSVAEEAWSEMEVAGEQAKRVDRVLDVRQGELCWVAGTVYMDMALKPNILDDVSKDKWISAPVTVQKYYAEDSSDQVALEDDSGRIRLVGDVIKTVPLVTGCIIAALGTENANGELEVLDIKFPDLAPQPERWTLVRPDDDDQSIGAAPASNVKKIAIVSGLGFSSTDSSYSLELQLLLEYLLGLALTPGLQAEIGQISRLIIAGNSISIDDHKPSTAKESEAKKTRKYGYDAGAYNPIPSQLFDEFLAQILPSMPVTLLPGDKDPANVSYPQQPIHTAMFPHARAYARGGSQDSKDAPKKEGEPAWFDAVTNPWEGEVEGWRVLGTGGQNIDDVFKYVSSDDRLGMMEAMCRWRCCAPTAPDTLWSYPFQEDDPFVITDCPHLFFVGCQPRFSTRVIHGPNEQVVRLITVPRFSETKELVLVDTETMDVSKVKFCVSHKTE